MIKLTKNALRDEQLKLNQLKRYLPTLQLKKAMLQSEVNHAMYEIEELKNRHAQQREKAEAFQSLLTDAYAPLLFVGTQVEEINKVYENIAGVDIPKFVSVKFTQPVYRLFTTPLWIDKALEELRALAILREQIVVAYEKKEALAKELREVSIRVNLFEKILIPRTEANIKKIRIFLGDQQLAAVAQAKVAKRKINLRKAAHDY